MNQAARCNFSLKGIIYCTSVFGGKNGLFRLTTAKPVLFIITYVLIQRDFLGFYGFFRSKILDSLSETRLFQIVSEIVSRADKLVFCFSFTYKSLRFCRRLKVFVWISVILFPFKNLLSSKNMFAVTCSFKLLEPIAFCSIEIKC